MLKPIFFIWNYSPKNPVCILVAVLVMTFGIARAETTITGVNFDWSTHIRLAQGSDNWPMTWAGDDHQYSSWGDGGGFGGTNADGRVSLGVARVEGPAASYTGYNVWGGTNPENQATFDGKSYGIISIEGILYMWVSPGSDATGYTEARLYQSSDHAASWSPASWAFVQSEELIFPTFLQFGKDYEGARDDYVYMYSVHLKDSSSLGIQTPGQIALLRVSKTNIMDRDFYEFFAGLDTDGNPAWTSNIALRQPVFQDGTGVGWNVSAIHNSGLNRYILITEHTTSLSGNIGIYEAPEPWGPWIAVLRQADWGAPNIEDTTFFWNLSPKWISEDGKDFTLVFTGIGGGAGNDSWNTVQGTFRTRGSDITPTFPPDGVVNSASFGNPADPFLAAIAPGTIVSIFGANLAVGASTADVIPLPTTLLTTRVSFNGTPAPLFFVSPGQINAQVPFEVPIGDGTVSVQVRKGGLVSNEQSISYATSSPGVFTRNQQGSGPGVILRADNFQAVTEAAPARPNDYLVIYATGLGEVQPAVASGVAAPSEAPFARSVSTPLVTIGGIPAEVIFSGLAPHFVGLYQLNLQVPEGVPAGIQTVEIIHHGVTSNVSTVAVAPL